MFLKNSFTNMAATIITTEDLYVFKMELIDEIKQLLNQNSGNLTKKWVKGPVVRKLLGISTSTLQNLRINRTLPFTKVGGTLYYDYQEVIQVFEKNKVDKKL